MTIFSFYVLIWNLIVVIINIIVVWYNGEYPEEKTEAIEEKVDSTKVKNLCRRKKITLSAHNLRKQSSFDNIQRKWETEDTKSIENRNVGKRTILIYWILNSQ